MPDFRACFCRDSYCVDSCSVGGFGCRDAYAFARARPAGLLRIRFTDLLWGLSLGLALRALQGWASGADMTAFPSASSTPGVPSRTWWLTEFFPAGFMGPVVEEFFFRAVVLVVVYQVFRRSVGMTAAAVTALLVSAGLFVLLHGMRGSLPLTDGIMLFAIGAVCGLLVLLTGRLWGAPHSSRGVQRLVSRPCGRWCHPGLTG